MIQDIDRGIDIAAPVARVWAVLTGEGLVEQWLGCLQFRAELGQVFYMQQDPARRAAGDLTGAIHCRIEAIDPPRRLAFSWYYPETPETLVEITVEPTPGGSRVRLLHSGWDQFDEAQIGAIRDGLDGGWSSFVLPGLKRLAES